METGKFKTPAGEILNVIQTNEENRQVLVDYGERRAWHSEQEFLTWEKVQEEQQEEKVEWETPAALEELAETPKMKEMLEGEKKPPKPATKKKTAPKKPAKKKGK